VSCKTDSTSSTPAYVELSAYSWLLYSCAVYNLYRQA